MWKNYEDIRVMDAYTDRIQKQYHYVSNTLVCPIIESVLWTKSHNSKFRTNTR
jgi:hypothetical protein